MEKKGFTSAFGGALIVFMAIVIGTEGASFAQAPEEKLFTKKIPETPEAIAAGKRLYFEKCSFCHGLEGKGDGAVADTVDPRPRDFTSGTFKLRTTASGELPLEENLFRTITRGIPGTAMPLWEPLSEEQRWQVIYYIKTFAKEFNAKRSPQKPTFGPEIPATPEVLQEGKKLYQKMKCWECHGQEGRGDGPSAPTLRDDWGFRIRAANLTQGWRYKGGTTVRDIYTRFSTGMNGTPMPSYADTLGDKERWQLAHYVKSLIHEEKAEVEVVLKPQRVEGDLPMDPQDPRWKEAGFLDIPLSGQVITRPRLQTPSVDLITVRALYNEREIAFLVEWDDRTQNLAHREAGNSPHPAGERTYPVLYPEREEEVILRDAVAIQFPVKIPEGPEKPHFFLGNPGKPVNLWTWKADGQGNQARATPVEEGNATGYKTPFTVQPPGSQTVQGKGVWSNGRWKVVMKRTLLPKDPDKDIPFERGKLIPLAFHAWDGSNGETGLQRSISSWYYLLIEKPAPLSVYLWTLAGMAAALIVERRLIRRVRQNQN